MADGFQGEAGSWFGSDDIGNVHYPRVKVNFGSDNSAIDVSPTNPLPVAMMSLGSVTVTPLSVQTAATGTNWVSFADQAAGSLDVCNNSGTAIEYRRVGTTPTFLVPNGAWRKIIGITNANQIEFRRIDTSNTQVAITAEALV